MSGAEHVVWPEVRREGSGATGRSRSNHAVTLGELPFELRADLEKNVGVPVDGDMAAALGLLRLQRLPHDAAALGNQFRELGASGVSADDRDGDAGEVLESNRR